MDLRPERASQFGRDLDFDEATAPSSIAPAWPAPTSVEAPAPPAWHRRQTEGGGVSPRSTQRTHRPLSRARQEGVVSGIIRCTTMAAPMLVYRRLASPLQLVSRIFNGALQNSSLASVWVCRRFARPSTVSPVVLNFQEFEMLTGRVLRHSDSASSFCPLNMLLFATCHRSH